MIIAEARIFETSPQETTFTSRNERCTHVRQDAHDPANSGLAEGAEPDGVASCSSAIDHDLAGVPWCRSGCDGLGRHPLVSVHRAHGLLRCMGTERLIRRYRGQRPEPAQGCRFLYEYDLNIPWEHEIRLEERLAPKPQACYPCCVGGEGTCTPEDCGGPDAWLHLLDDARLWPG